MRAYERLLDYVKVYTTSDPESGTHPSAAREFDLAHKLVEELKALGVEDARVDEHCYVYGSLPATPGCEEKPALGLIAHMDTAPDASGENVNPILHENYDGGDVVLPATGKVMKVSAFPFLASMKGETLITTDGTTLLGADDKAGVAEIMTAVETIIREGRPHGKLCIGFTPDEEIGEGADLFDIPGFGADFAYTVDGGDAGDIEYENFNAAAATVTIHGFSVHPGSAKDTMINASNVAMEFHGALPVMARPETTEGRQGFYHLCQMYGDVTTAKLGYILRDHDAAKLQFKKDNMQDIADYLNGKYGAGTVEVEIKDSYRNMLEKIKPHFHLIETARKAVRMAGLEPVEVPVRGGTDGATLSWMGLPCPNLGTGGFNFHGVCECTTVERMDRCTEDKENLAIAADCGVTGVMLPFVRGAEDIRNLRQALAEAGAPQLKILAKIENLAGVQALPEFLPLVDEVVIARGDLGNAMPLWELPRCQKQLSAACRAAGVPFMVVTQMLDSMHTRAVPTRAEVSDIYNAVLDGASSLMLTGETAAGQYPVQAMEYLVRTARTAM